MGAGLQEGRYWKMMDGTVCFFPWVVRGRRGRGGFISTKQEVTSDCRLHSKKSEWGALRACSERMSGEEEGIFGANGNGRGQPRRKQEGGEKTVRDGGKKRKGRNCGFGKLNQQQPGRHRKGGGFPECGALQRKKPLREGGGEKGKKTGQATGWAGLAR